MNIMPVLVDFDNFGNFSKLKKVKQHNINYVVDQLIAQTVAWVKKNKIHVHEILFRIYGGWHLTESETEATDRFYMLSSAIREVKKIYEKIRIKFSIAESLAIKTDTILTKSLSEYAVNKKLQVNQSVLSQCSKNPCTLHIIDNWLRNGCPAPCNVKQNKVFIFQEQKLVDTIIVCDLIYYAHSNEYDYIGVVSGDYDLIPGIIYAIELGNNIVQFRNKERLHYDKLIPKCKIVHSIIANH